MIVFEKIDSVKLKEFHQFYLHIDFIFAQIVILYSFIIQSPSFLKIYSLIQQAYFVMFTLQFKN